ncbi:ribonuclease P protein component [Candidatus Shapirobacteria bacterium]|nr:ribonuclease P protein component [Candidatus Shapirobacteria bacterium]
MLKKINRISKKEEFEEVRAKGEMLSTPLFGLLWMKNVNPSALRASPLHKGDKDCKFGTIVSKKISKKAVDRNRIRRVLFEAVRKNMDIFPEGFRGIFLARKTILDKSYQEVEECLKTLCFSASSKHFP